jgi:pyruvate-ferredoxin/flavodoxin oxidoreductase
MAMGYRHVYVASVAFGAKDAQTVRAFVEAESYPGPSLVIAYSHCIAHGYDLAHGLEQQALAVRSALWPLYRFDPRRIPAGLPPLQLDSGPPSIGIEKYMQNEGRFRMSEKVSPARYRELVTWAQHATTERFSVYEQLAKMTIAQTGPIPDEPPPLDPEG